MSAPAGWYPTPDGRERFWDGEAWSDQIRDATPTVATSADQASDVSGGVVTDGMTGGTDAAVTGGAATDAEVTQTTPAFDATTEFDPTSAVDVAEPRPWDADAAGQGALAAPASDATQQIGTDATQQIGTAYGIPPLPAQPAAPAYAQPAAPAYGQGGQGVPPVYGQPGGAYAPAGAPYGQPPKKSGKGCLIAALVTAALVVVLGIVGVVLVARFVDKVAKDPTSVLPSDLASSLASEFPTDLPSDLPSPIDPSAPGGSDNPIVTTIGGEIAFGEVTIGKGWTLEKGDLPGLADIKGMTGTTTGTASPMMFDLTFSDGTTELGTTFCTANPDAGATTFEVKCLPVEDKAVSATKVSATMPF